MLQNNNTGYQGQQQLNLFSAQQEAELFHRTDRFGYFTVLQFNKHRQAANSRSYRLVDMPRILDGYKFAPETYLSQAQFLKPNRRAVHMSQVGLCFADLDTYRQDWSQGRTPEQLAQSALWLMAQDGVPEPSILVFSGRGLQAKWLLSRPIPRQALPRWNAVQKHLTLRLSAAGLGADLQARDVSRVLRLVDSTHSKTGERVRVLHVKTGADDLPFRYQFDDLAHELLPVERSAVRGRSRRGKRTGSARQAFNALQLAWDRLGDLRLLARIRGGYVAEGERMLHLLYRLNFLALSGQCHSSVLIHEARQLAQEIDPNWHHRQAELSTLLHKARAHERGERVQFQGRDHSPLYTPRNQTLIDVFGITQEEEREMRTVISEDERKRRDRERDTKRRRDAGAVERAEYLEKPVERRKQAQALKAEGFSVAEIAEKVGISTSHAYRLVN